jgi:cyclophilin family peptidyl-prolyl cis-trans isomerase
MSADLTEIVTLETTKGNIEIKLNRAKAPVTVENFIKYVNDGFFDGTVFHRVIPGFMIQGGGFTQEGVQKSTRQPIRLEARNGLRNAAGTVAMARTNNPDSATSQFFINLIDNDFLNASAGNQGYTVFGEVTIGIEVVKTIAAVKTASRGQHGDWPNEDILIKRAYMKKVAK